MIQENANHLPSYQSALIAVLLPLLLLLLPLLLLFVQIGFPLQYNQYPLRRVFWNIGFMAQAIIHKILPFLISPPLFLMIQDPKMSYSRILEATERSRKLVLVLGAVFAAAAAWLLRRLVAQI